MWSASQPVMFTILMKATARAYALLLVRVLVTLRTGGLGDEPIPLVER